MKIKRLDLVAFFLFSLILFYEFRGNIFSGSVISIGVVFVLIGFLVTARALDRFAADQKLTLSSFLFGALKILLLPLIFLVILIVPLALIFNRELLTGLGSQLAATLGFANNFYQTTSLGSVHFINANELFFHVWPLAISAQFLLVWTMLLLLIAKISARSSRAVRQMRILTFIAAGLISVVGLMILGRETIAGASYARLYFSATSYLLPFFVGSSLACLYGYQTAPQNFVDRILHLSSRRQLLMIGIDSLLVLGIAVGTHINHYWQYFLIIVLGCILAATVLHAIRVLQIQRQITPNIRTLYFFYLLYLTTWPLSLILADHFSATVSFGLALLFAIISALVYQLFAKIVVRKFLTISHPHQVRISAGVLIAITAMFVFAQNHRPDSVDGATDPAATLAQLKSAASDRIITTTTATTKTTAKTTSTAATTNDKTATELKTAWQKILNTTNSHVQIAVYSNKTKQTYRLSNVSTTTTFDTASIVKVSVLTELLKQKQDSNTTLTASEKAYAVKMIEDSDNDATTYLLNNQMGGYTATQALFDDIKMTQSTANADAWGNTQTTATDQVKLLNAIYYNTGNYLSTASRKYIKTLMANVEDTQDWGVSAGATSYHVKNGWLNASDGTWRVNSIGHIEDGDYTIAVLTNNNSDETAGIDLIESLAKVTHDILD